MARLPKPKFYLRRPKSKSDTLISLMVSYQGKRLVYSTECSIHPKDWDAKIQRPLIKTNRPDLFHMKRQLDDLAAYCVDIFAKANFEPIDEAELKRQLDIKTGKIDVPGASPSDSGTIQEEESKRPTFFKFIEQEIAEMKATNMKWNSFKVFRNHANILRQFAEETYGKKKLFDYEDIDWNMRLKLIDWLADRNAQIEYGNKTLKVLRQFADRAKRKKLHNNTDYQGVGWTVTKKKATGQKVVLTVDELEYLVDMPLNGFLDKVRDICLIGAGTGQRHSDFSRYKPDNFYKTINGIPILSLVSIKTETPSKIPLNIFPWLVPVLEKHDYATPEMSMQKFNEGLKILCQQAGFIEKILKVEQFMGRKARVVKSYVPKYEEVASHICRRSFATNLYRMGYSLAQIMPMTGHSTESQLRQYIGIDNEMNAEAIALSIIKRDKEISKAKYKNRGHLRVVTN